MVYCNSTDSQAVVKLTKNSKAFQVIIDGNLPISIGCKNNGFNNGIRVKVTYSFNRSLGSYVYPKSTAEVVLFAPIGGIRGQKETSEYFSNRPASAPVQIAINTQGSWSIVQDLLGNSGFFINISIDSIVPVDPSVIPTPKGVIIKDKNGSIVYDDNTIDCTWDVICGGGCPEGFCKCVTPGYPGYCCLDCTATAANIRNITNDLRSKNG